MQPDIRYTKSGDVHIAYQVFGAGPLDLVYIPGFISRFLAKHIPGAKLVELDGPDHLPWLGDNAAEIADMILYFIANPGTAMLSPRLDGSAGWRPFCLLICLVGNQSEKRAKAPHRISAEQRSGCVPAKSAASDPPSETPMRAARLLPAASITVGSTDRAQQSGDKAWRALLEAHDTTVRTSKVIGSGQNGEGGCNGLERGLA
jgi:hypothetical protein